METRYPIPGRTYCISPNTIIKNVSSPNPHFVELDTPYVGSIVMWHDDVMNTLLMGIVTKQYPHDVRHPAAISVVLCDRTAWKKTGHATRIRNFKETAGLKIFGKMSDTY